MKVYVLMVKYDYTRDWTTIGVYSTRERARVGWSPAYEYHIEEFEIDKDT